MYWGNRCPNERAWHLLIIKMQFYSYKNSPCNGKTASRSAVGGFALIFETETNDVQIIFSMEIAIFLFKFH